MESATEQGKYWMWARRKFVCRNPYGDSWEEQAFAADAAGGLEGCTWPPRSYSCSFCRREFRSAQALGGHMNVHRRDRARLKASSPPPPNGEADHAVQPLDSHLRDRLHQLPSVCNSNPNREVVVAASSQPPPPPLLSGYGDERTRSQRKRSFLSMDGPLDLKLGMDGSDPIQARQLYCFEDGISLGCKRQRSDHSSVDDIDPTTSKDEIDLELRLGDGPKIK